MPHRASVPGRHGYSLLGDSNQLRDDVGLKFCWYHKPPMQWLAVPIESRKNCQSRNHCQNTRIPAHTVGPRGTGKTPQRGSVKPNAHPMAPSATTVTKITTSKRCGCDIRHTVGAVRSTDNSNPTPLDHHIFDRFTKGWLYMETIQATTTF